MKNLNANSEHYIQINSKVSTIVNCFVNTSYLHLYIRHDTEKRTTIAKLKIEEQKFSSFRTKLDLKIVAAIGTDTNKFIFKLENSLKIRQIAKIKVHPNRIKLSFPLNFEK